MAVQKVFEKAVGDVRSIGEVLRVLPEIAASLKAIEKRVENLDEEVMLMRRGVDALGDEVGEMHTGIDKLDHRIKTLTNVLRPWRRAGRRAADEIEPPAEEAAAG
jgi:uncharacterized coiled-coil protein SlyX